MKYIGIDLGGTDIKAGIVDSNGSILHSDITPTRVSEGPQAIIEDMAHLALRLLDESGTSLDEIHSVGAGVPGIANPDNGSIYFCTNLGWHNVAFREIFQTIMNKPVFIENDATVAGLAEWAAGVCKGTRYSVFLTLGTGVGGGIIMDGKVYSGPHHIASELGHMVVQLNGDLCTCGNRGCWERYASASAMIRMAQKAVLGHPESLILQSVQGDMQAIRAKHVVDAAKAGDSIGTQVFQEYVYNLTMGIVSIINMYDPEVIALGGGVSKAGAFLRDAVREELPKHIFYKDVSYARIELATLGNDAGVIGAAMLGLE